MGGAGGGWKAGRGGRRKEKGGGKGKTHQKKGASNTKSGKSVAELYMALEGGRTLGTNASSKGRGRPRGARPETSPELLTKPTLWGGTFKNGQKKTGERGHADKFSNPR